jgi:hypothetical protein
MSTIGLLDSTVTATLGRVREGDTWICVQLPESAKIFGTRGLVKVSGTVNGHPSDGAFMALGGGTHKLPVSTAVRRATGTTEGDEVTIHLTRRRNKARQSGPDRASLYGRRTVVASNGTLDERHEQTSRPRQIRTLLGQSARWARGWRRRTGTG